jgi:hypothetical protein
MEVLDSRWAQRMREHIEQVLAEHPFRDDKSS